MNYELNLDGYAVVRNVIPMDMLTGLWEYARDILQIHSGAPRTSMVVRYTDRTGRFRNGWKEA